jgi:hypothetical protein
MKDRLLRGVSLSLTGLTLMGLLGFVLLFVYAFSLVNPARPDYHLAKLRMMFNLPEPGIVTIPALLGFLTGLAMLLWGMLFALLRPPACHPHKETDPTSMSDRWAAPSWNDNGDHVTPKPDQVTYRPQR